MKPSAIRGLLVKLIPAREPVLLVGSPGVGKSDIVCQVARALDYDLVLTHPVVEDPTDYKGLPAVVAGDAGPTAAFLPFGQLRLMLDATRPTLVMLDDLGQGPPAVQAAVMQLVLGRNINGQRISDHVTFVAATNRREDRAAVTGMITPLLDRFVTALPVDFDLEEWISWGIDNQMPPELLAFARLRPDSIGKFEPTRDMKKQPTPRSVAGLGRLVALGITDLQALAGAAGESFATEFVAFYRTWSTLPDRNEIYLNPMTAPIPDAPDVLFALMGSLAYGASPSNFDQTVLYLSRVPPEYSVLCVRDAVRRTKALTNTRAFNEWARSHAPVLGYDAAA